MDKKTLLDLIKNDGYEITKEITDAASELFEILDAQKLKLDDIASAMEWLDKKRRAYNVTVKEISMNELDKWNVNPQTGHISHESGKFYSIIGVSVKGAMGREVVSWTQPMIKQEERGILGILCKKINGIRHYLLFAKFEPGTIAGLQLSPTLQATESNLKQMHGGKKPQFSEYFENEGMGTILVNVVEVEDPGRFYHKTNHCMIVEIPEDKEVAIPNDFIWLTFPQIKKLLKIDNVINALTRCVWGSR